LSIDIICDVSTVTDTQILVDRRCLDFAQATKIYNIAKMNPAKITRYTESEWNSYMLSLA